MQIGTRNRTWCAAVTALVAAGALAAPAGARAGGAEWTAVEGGPCDDTVSVPVAGKFKQLYECVADQWVVSDGVGSPGPAGRDGASGADGTDGAAGAPGNDGAPGQPGSPGARGADGTNGVDGTPGADGRTGPVGPSGAGGATGPAGATGPVGPAGPEGPAGPGLSMYSGSFPGPAAWEVGADAPLLPAMVGESVGEGEA